MKKVILLATIVLIAIYCFCQWPPGFFKNYFGANTNNKYIEFTSKNATNTNSEYLGDGQPTYHSIYKEQPVYGVEHMPQFPGGEEALKKFIRDNLHYPKISSEVGIQGRVTIRFVINRNGEVTDITVIRGLDPPCDKEAVRVVKKMPRWTPGHQNGRTVPVYYTLPIVFKLKK